MEQQLKQPKCIIATWCNFAPNTASSRLRPPCHRTSSTSWLPLSRTGRHLPPHTSSAQASAVGPKLAAHQQAPGSTCRPNFGCAISHWTVPVFGAVPHSLLIALQKVNPNYSEGRFMGLYERKCSAAECFTNLNAKQAFSAQLQAKLEDFMVHQ